MLQPLRERADRPISRNLTTLSLSTPCHLNDSARTRSLAEEEEEEIVRDDEKNITFNLRDFPKGISHK